MAFHKVIVIFMFSITDVRKMTKGLLTHSVNSKEIKHHLLLGYLLAITRICTFLCYLINTV